MRIELFEFVLEITLISQLPIFPLVSAPITKYSMFEFRLVSVCNPSEKLYDRGDRIPTPVLTSGALSVNVPVTDSVFVYAPLTSVNVDPL